MVKMKLLARDEVAGHLRKVARSGKSLAAYARANEIPTHVLYHARDAQRRRASSAFVRVESVPPAQSLDPIAIQLPNGIVVTFAAPGDLAALLRTLCAL